MSHGSHLQGHSHPFLPSAERACKPTTGYVVPVDPQLYLVPFLSLHCQNIFVMAGMIILLHDPTCFGVLNTFFETQKSSALEQDMPCQLYTAHPCPERYGSCPLPRALPFANQLVLGFSVIIRFVLSSHCPVLTWRVCIALLAHPPTAISHGLQKLF